METIVFRPSGVNTINNIGNLFKADSNDLLGCEGVRKAITVACRRLQICPELTRIEYFKYKMTYLINSQLHGLFYPDMEVLQRHKKDKPSSTYVGYVCT